MARAAQVRESKPEEQDNTNAAEDQDNVADAPAEGSDSPVLDLTDAAVKRLIKTAKARGYVTLDELNSVMPSDRTDTGVSWRWQENPPCAKDTPELSIVTQTHARRLVVRYERLIRISYYCSPKG